MGIGFQTKSKSKKCTCWLNSCYHSTDKGLHCTKMKKEILNCIEKYRVLWTYWTPLVCSKIIFLTFGLLYSVCQEYAKTACNKVLSCGHLCGGVKDEDPCLPCLHRCRTGDQELLKQDADDMCMICFTEALSAAPAILVCMICVTTFDR